MLNEIRLPASSRYQLQPQKLTTGQMIEALTIQPHTVTMQQLEGTLEALEETYERDLAAYEVQLHPLAHSLSQLDDEGWLAGVGKRTAAIQQDLGAALERCGWKAGSHRENLPCKFEEGMELAKINMANAAQAIKGEIARNYMMVMATRPTDRFPRQVSALLADPSNGNKAEFLQKQTYSRKAGQAVDAFHWRALHRPGDLKPFFKNEELSSSFIIDSSQNHINAIARGDALGLALFLKKFDGFKLAGMSQELSRNLLLGRGGKMRPLITQLMELAQNDQPNFEIAMREFELHPDAITEIFKPKYELMQCLIQDSEYAPAFLILAKTVSPAVLQQAVRNSFGTLFIGRFDTLTDIVTLLHRGGLDGGFLTKLFLTKWSEINGTMMHFAMRFPQSKSDVAAFRDALKKSGIDDVALLKAQSITESMLENIEEPWPA
ncbi:hypothetical protein [Variovorax saccharolyticus]|uniref:hypothetical protein n=1 Tax=Variovorax saccharolyticus TaxID=3053516 RepID=UPI002577251C|nr:hypothetical protein [Variovorax sp. J31P216]MDM0029933.1 hypothetical protein [Variovorax sp. J31P216]